MMGVVLLLLLLLCTTSTHAFQFMKGWKVPVYDPNQEEAEARFGDKKLVVVTGASSGLGRKATLALLRSGDYHVIGAVRDLDKMEAVAEVDGFEGENFTPMQCELNSFDSVRDFCRRLDDFRLSKPIDRLVCNAGVYQPSLPYAKWSQDNHEQTMQINFLSHFLMISLLFPALQQAHDSRVIMVGSVTGNDNTVGGGGVYPIADLHELDGFKAGFKNPVSMADGYGFIGAKAYKDSKLCLMIMANLLHTKYHKLTGVSFCSMYPGCIAESPLFREKRDWFRAYFPVFMKFITGGFVGEHEAGQRLFQVAHDPRCSKSGAYWSWNGGPREGRGAEALEKGGQISGGGGAGGGWDSIFENDQSAKVLDVDTAMKLFEYSSQITGAEWPELKAITSPCPTLKVIGAVTKGMVQREELKRMREMGRPGMSATGELIAASSQDQVADVTEGVAETTRSMPIVPTKKPKLSVKKRVFMKVDRVVSFVLGNTLGRVARFASKRVLGQVPDTALNGSFQPTVADQKKKQKKSVDDTRLDTTLAEMQEDQALLESEVAPQLQQEEESSEDPEDEALFRQLYQDEAKEKTELQV